MDRWGVPELCSLPSQLPVPGHSDASAARLKNALCIKNVRESASPAQASPRAERSASVRPCKMFLNPFEK